MRRMSGIFLVALLCGVVAMPAGGTEWDGTVKLGGIYLDEQYGDLSSVQETYNIYDGFSLTELRLGARFNPRSSMLLRLYDANLDNRRAYFDLRIPTTRLYVKYDQNRQVFDADRAVTSERNDWQFGAQVDPVNWLGITGTYNLQNRDGNRLGFPSGTQSAQLGSYYDYRLQTGRLEGQFKHKRAVLALGADFSDYTDNVVAGANRDGYVIYVRLFMPAYFTDRLTHAIRGAYGSHNLSDSDLRNKITNFQYTGAVALDEHFEFKYNFFFNRTDDNATQLQNVTSNQTDNIRNDFNLTYRYQHGSVWGGYAYEINDDDRSITDYNDFRVGASVRAKDRFRAKLDYRNRIKTDMEKRTLLKDMETASVLGKIDFDLTEDLVIGAKYLNRERDMPDINSNIKGENVTVYGRYYLEYSGDQTIGTDFILDYTYADDDYMNPTGTFRTKSNSIGARIDIDYEKKLMLGAGVTYLDVGKDLDIEKSILSFDVEYIFKDDYHVEVKYNVYNYDDYILLGRYYTANVVWINVGYDFSIE